jgi:GNAT superfamily N-acetyltransferase
MQIKVRPIVIEDYSNWLPLWNGYLEFYKTTLPIEQTQLTFQRMLDPSIPLEGLVAEDETGRLLGLITFVYHYSTFAPKSYCYIEDLFIGKEARGFGVATHLIEAVCELAKEAGSSKIYWQTHETNAVARHLYDKIASNHGFIIYSRKLS